DPAVARRQLGEAWSAALGAVNREAVRSMWLTQLANDKPAEINMELTSARAATAAVASLRERLMSARLRPSVFIEAVGGDAERVELIPSAATEVEAERLARRVIEAMRAKGFRLADSARTSGSRIALSLQWDERLLAANGIDRGMIESDVRAALGNIDAGQA